MGCWNETCGASRLPIYHGDPIVALLTKAVDLDSHQFEFNNHPLTLALYGEYDDYGGIENIDKTRWAAAAKVIDLFPLHEPLKSEHGRHNKKLGDKPVSGLDFSKLEGLDRECEAWFLRYKDAVFQGDSFTYEVIDRPVRLSYVHRSVWDAMIEAVKRDEQSWHIDERSAPDDELWNELRAEAPKSKKQERWYYTTLQRVVEHRAYRVLPKTLAKLSDPELGIFRRDYLFDNFNHCFNGIFNRHSRHIFNIEPLALLAAVDPEVMRGIIELEYISHAQVKGRLVIRSEVGHGSQNTDTDIQQAIFKEGLKIIKATKTRWSE